MRLSGLRWWVAAMATIVCVSLVHRSAAAEEPSSVLQDILKIMRENGQITEEQKNELLRRAQQEAEHSITPLEGKDVAAAIVFAVTQPEHVSISELLIRPTEQV